MKKLIALLLAMTTIFAFSACGSNKDGEKSSADPETNIYTGVLEEKKDFMVVVSAEEGEEPYIFTLEDGVTCDAEVGDKVNVIYTGDITKYSSYGDEILIATQVEVAE